MNSPTFFSSYRSFLIVLTTLLVCGCSIASVMPGGTAFTVTARETVIGSFPKQASDYADGGDTFSCVWISRNGRHLAYIGKSNNGYRLFVDGKAQPGDVEPDYYFSFEFSENGEHYAYRARIAGKPAAVIDGVIIKGYDSIQVDAVNE